MANRLLALHTADAHQEVLDRVIGEAFEMSGTSFSPDGQTFHFNDLAREGNVVRNVDNGQAMTVDELNAILSDFRASVSDSSFEQEESGELRPIAAERNPST